MNSLEQAIADLRKTVEANPNRDRFPVGTVIRWVASGRYTYLAVKTDYAWFTTARPGNPFVKQQLDYEDLQEILSRTETTDIAVATSWSALDGTSVADPGLPLQAFSGGVFREVSRSRAGLYPEGDPSADAGNHRSFEEANPGVTFDEDEPGYDIGGSGENV